MAEDNEFDLVDGGLVVGGETASDQKNASDKPAKAAKPAKEPKVKGPTKKELKAQEKAAKEAAAAAAEAERQERLKSRPALADRPRKLDKVKLEDLVCASGLQRRANLINPKVVADYAEFLKEGGEFKDPVQVVYDEDKNCFWVWNGFQRTAAYELAKWDKLVDVEVTEGDFNDAFLLSCGANSDQVALQRDRDTQRRSVVDLVTEIRKDGSPIATYFHNMLEAPDSGGVHRILASICKVSRGTVENALTHMGLCVRSGKFAKLPERPAGTTAATEDETGADGDGETTGKKGKTPTAPMTEAEKKDARDAQWKSMLAKSHIERLQEGQRAAKNMMACIASLVVDKSSSPIVAELLEAHGMLLPAEGIEKITSDEGEPYFAIMEHWALARNLLSFYKEAISVMSPTETAGN